MLLAETGLELFTEHLLPAFWVMMLISLSVLGCGLSLLGMPGNWLILLAAFGYDAVIADGSRIEMGERVLIVLLLLAIAGEALELLTGAAGVARMGGSRRGAAGALLGSLVGGLFGAGVGIPVLIVGPVVGMIVFAAIGAMVGTVVAEHSTGRELRESIDIGMAAMWGRMAGSLAKTMVGGVMVVVVLLGLVT